MLQEALTDDFVAAHPVARVPSYEGLEGPRTAQVAGAGTVPDTAADRAAEEEIKAQLVSLGYIGGGAEGSGGTSPGAPAGGSAPVGVKTLLYHTNLGAVYLAKKQYEQAEAEFRMALRIDPTSPQALLGMAVLEESRGNLEQALQNLQEVVRQETGADHPNVIKVAEMFIRMRKPLDGIAYMKTLEPSHNRGDQRELGLRVGLGMLYSAAGRPREAETALLRAIAIEPTSVSAMQELFSVLDGQGRSSELRPLIEAALRKNPRSAMHHTWLGLVLRRQEDLKGAESEFHKAIEAAPDLVGALANLGSLYIQEGRQREAVDVLRQAVSKDARNLEARTNLIVALGMGHDLDGSRKLVKEAEGMGLRVPLFYNALAYALHINGRSQEALETLRDSLRLDPRQPDALRLQSEIESGHPADQLPYR